MTIKPLVLQRPYTDEDGRRMLSGYIQMDDRAPPPIFVGREEIIAGVMEDVSFCRSNTRDTTCFTSVIKGVPSAGKTSLLSEIEKRLERDNQGVLGNVTLVYMSGHELSHEVVVAQRFIECHQDRRMDLGEVLKLSDRIQATGNLWRTIRERIASEIEPPVFLLLVDESQNIKGVDRGSSGKNHIVTNLHNGSGTTDGLKIVSVFAGLLDTDTALYRTGIARLRGNSITHLGGLTQDKTKELVTRWMQHEEFGFEHLFSDADIDRVSDILTVACDCWPRHAYAYLRDFAQSILDAGRCEDQEVDLDAVLDHGHDAILRYYQQRLRTADLECYGEAIRDRAQSSNDGIFTQRELFDYAKDHYRMTYSEIDKQHESALHAGILDQAGVDEYERVKFPIPSQFIYMKAGSGEKFKSKMRERVNAHLIGTSEVTQSQSSVLGPAL